MSADVPTESDGPSPILNFTLTLGTCINIVLFFSEVPLVRRLIKERRAEGYCYLPMLSLAALSSLWLSYTVLVKPEVFAYWFNNILGLSVASSILFVHMRFSQPERRRKLALTLLGTVVGCVLFYIISFKALEFSTAVRICASTTVGVNILFFVTPLKQLFLALKSLDTSRVPVTLSVVAFCGSSTWTVNGILLGDPYIWVANVVGLLLTTTQLGILVYIRRARKRLGDAGVAPTQLQDGAAAAAPTSVTGTAGATATAGPGAGTVSAAELEAGAQWRLDPSFDVNASATVLSPHMLGSPAGQVGQLQPAFSAGSGHPAASGFAVASGHGHGHGHGTARPSLAFAGKLEASTTALVVRTGVAELETSNALHARILARLASAKGESSADFNGNASDSGDSSSGHGPGQQNRRPPPPPRSALLPVAEDSQANFAETEEETAALALSVGSPQLQAIPVQA